MSREGRFRVNQKAPGSRPGPQAVLEQAVRLSAALVGGRTVRRDNPHLTTRREDGHHPARIVLTRSMDLPGIDDVNRGLGTGDEGDEVAQAVVGRCRLYCIDTRLESA